MQQTMRKLQRKWKKHWRLFIERTMFIGKLIISLLFIFFFILFLITGPLNHFETSSTNDLYEVSENKRQSEEEFIQAILPQAKKVKASHGIRPSILIAQAALESDWGNSQLSKESNNYFGIKGPNSGREYVTREFTSDEWTEILASFKQYDSIGESVKDYADLLLYGVSWDPNYYLKVIEASNYQDAAYFLQEAGYATDPNYADKLIQLIEQYQLYRFDE